MKRKNLFSIVLVLVLCSLCILPAGAAGQAEKVDLGDGYYMEVYVVTDPQTRGSSNTSGSKTLVVYNASDDPLFSLTVHGTFVFNGTTATAVSASESRPCFLLFARQKPSAAAVINKQIRFVPR